MNHRLDGVREPGFWRFSGGFLQIFLLTLCLGWLYRLMFAWSYRESLWAAGADNLLPMLLGGLQMDLAVAAFVLAPALLLYHLLGASGWWPLRYLLYIYLAALVLLIPLVGFVDLQYFDESGKHLTYEATAYLDSTGVSVFAGAFELHPWISALSLLASLAIPAAFLIWLRRLLGTSLPRYGQPRPVYLLALPLWLLLSAVALRGGLQPIPIGVGHCAISGNPYVNGYCLNPVYSVLVTTIGAGDTRYRFYDEVANGRRIRAMLGSETAVQTSSQFPLLRTSPGIAGGNRKNVVLFILESWTGKDVAGLGGDAAITPTFASLSQQGLLFTRFYASGIRTAEGVFSILASFPNQPQRPVMARPIASQVRWRSLNQILGEVGYETMFINGKSLDHDNMKNFLKGLGFDEVIDRQSFPASMQMDGGAWKGYHDEQVMRVANDWFRSRGENPFLGVIYTMDTHPPFVTPDDFPPILEPNEGQNRFLNSLHYSDYSLQVFFDLARQQPYFDNTVFVFVADHSRTRDSFTMADQHHIPLLIYSPGYVDAARNSTVGSQLDILPTVLGLLNLSASHASFGRDLIAARDNGFAMAIAGGDARWHQDGYLLNDALTRAPPFLCHEVQDPQCRNNLWQQDRQQGERMQERLRSYLSLSQTLMYEDRVYPRSGAGQQKLMAGKAQ
ncbi:MAG TPA: LTA synthase family protein [Gammaproteobacteria bacterium]|nr:LTA synthase family protein [Gammaproteobacteria bacterium]